jgi:hypothetical protein
MKKFAFAAICTLALVGFVTADEFVGAITKVEGSKVYFTKGKKGEDKKEGTAEATADVKVMTGMFDKDAGDFKMKAGDPIEGGLKNAMFKDIGEKGVFAQITTNDAGKITQILTFKGFGGKKKGG